MRRAWQIGLLASLLAVVAGAAPAAENLKINPNLKYDSDSDEGPLFTGIDLSNARIAGDRPTHIIFFQRTCYNSKRQARRTVALYEKYRGRVHFITVDLDTARAPEQRRLIDRFYRGSIPHLTILGKDGRVLCNDAGEVSEKQLADIFDRALAY